MQISKGKIEGAQKVVIVGVEGIGKSTFASQFPNPVFIDTEGSTKHMDVARTDKPSSWTMLLEQVRYFKANPQACDTLIIDTADWAEQLCIAEVCAKAQKTGIEDFGYGKGYTYLVEEFGKLLNLLEEVVESGINVVLTAHATMRKFEQPDEMGSYDRWEMKLAKKTGPLVKEWADMVLMANYKTYVVKTDDKKNKAQGGKRVMYTTHHPCWDAKNRHRLPEELPFEYQAIAHCIPTKQVKAEQAKTKPPEESFFLDDDPALKNIQTEGIRYWNHPESGCVYTTKKGDNLGKGDGLGVELSKEEYEKWKLKYEQLEPPKQEPQATSQELSDVPKALADLMTTNNVTVTEIQQAVADKGYYPIDTPISNYDPQFISGVLVAAWPAVFQMIKDFRSDEPF